MSHIISGLLWNTCIAGGLAIVIFLAQQTKFLRIRPQVCHALWLLVLVKLISPTFFAIPVSIGLARSERVRNEQLAIPALARRPRTTGNAETISAAGGAETLRAQTVDVMLTPQFAIAVSAFGSLALLLTSLSRVRLIGRLVQHAEPASPWIQDRVAVASRKWRTIKCVPSVRMVHGTISPFLWGTLRRVQIILPSRLISTMEPESVELIIQHELAHYARRDHWTNHFATTLVILFWWNPVVWLARRELRIQQEWCCDRMVVAQDRSQRVRYAETLLAAVDFVASSGATCPSPATAFGSCNTLQRRVEMVVSQHSLPCRSNCVSVFLFALIVLPLGIANAEEEEKDWSAERREFVERIEEFTREIEELRYDDDDYWAKHLVGRRDYFNGMLPMLDEILKTEQSLKEARAGQDVTQADQLEGKLEALVDKFRRAERIGEMEGRLSELKDEKHELAEEGEDKARQRVEVFVADQAKLLKQLRDLHKIVETDDDERIEELEQQVNQREESLLLRIDEFHLERRMIEARDEGENVQELESELQEVRNALRELLSGSK